SSDSVLCFINHHPLGTMVCDRICQPSRTDDILSHHPRCTGNCRTHQSNDCRVRTDDSRQRFTPGFENEAFPFPEHYNHLLDSDLHTYAGEYFGSTGRIPSFWIQSNTIYVCRTGLFSRWRVLCSLFSDHRADVRRTGLAFLWHRLFAEAIYPLHLIPDLCGLLGFLACPAITRKGLLSKPSRRNRRSIFDQLHCQSISICDFDELAILQNKSEHSCCHCLPFHSRLFQ